MAQRLADEFDAAQERGEVASGRTAKSSEGEDFQATVTDLGMSHKEIHEARQIRDAELAGPGIVLRSAGQRALYRTDLTFSHALVRARSYGASASLSIKPSPP